jgi:hypothetical protein
MAAIKKLRRIVFNIPENITAENAAQATILKNSELNYICVGG